MLVDKRPYISCANDNKMSFGRKKKRVIESYSRPIKAK